MFFDIAEPNSDCATIIKSPADTTIQGCGTTIGTFKNAVCAELQIKDTFMVQFCCGQDDCTAAGVANAKRGETVRVESAVSFQGIFGSSLKHSNGSEIVPVQQGDMPQVSRKRDSCVYTADAGMEEYTRPADSTQIVTDVAVNGGTGGSSVDITKSRTQSWETSIEASVDIFEIVSTSVSFSFSKSITDSTTYSFNVPAGENGQVGFTANLRCTTGETLERSFGKCT